MALNFRIPINGYGGNLMKTFLKTGILFLTLNFLMATQLQVVVEVFTETW